MAFAINRALVLGFRGIGGGHATASKVFSFLGLCTWNDNFELKFYPLIIAICVRPESTVYSPHVPSKGLQACCISPVKRLLLLWTIRCYDPVVGKMPPKYIFGGRHTRWAA